MLATHLDAAKRYSELIKQALSATMSVLNNDIVLSQINSIALNQTRLRSQPEIKKKTGVGLRDIVYLNFVIPKDSKWLYGIQIN